MGAVTLRQLTCDKEVEFELSPCKLDLLISSSRLGRAK